MAYNEVLADMIRAQLADMGLEPEEKKMFGGIAYLLEDRMMAGIVKDDLMVRTTLDRYAQAVNMPHARPMDFTNRPMKGFIYVAWQGIHNNPVYLRQFLDYGLEYINSPEGKAAAAKKAKQKK